MVEVGRDLLRSLVQPPLLKAYQGGQIASAMSSWVWLFARIETPQPVWTNCSSVWSPLQWKFFSNGIFYISVCAHCLLSHHWAPQRRVCLHLYSPLQIIFIYKKRYFFPWAIFSWLSNPSSQPFHTCQMLSSCKHLCGLLLYMPQYLHICSVLGSPKLDPEPWTSLPSAEQRR